MATTEQISQIICDGVDWEQPELKGSAFHQALLDGRPESAALGLIRHLRERETPNLGYSAAYIESLRANVTPEFLQEARDYMDRIIDVEFLGGSYPDGRGTLIGTRPELIQVAEHASSTRMFHSRL